MQNCTKCWIQKPLSDFQKRKESKTWYRKDCKYCCKLVKSKYYLEHKDYFKEKHSNYYLENKEEIDARNREYHRIHKETIKEQRQSYFEEYRINNREICNERVRKWAETDNWKEHKILKEWKRRALKKSSEDWTINIESVTELFDIQWWVCVICKCDISTRKRHLDHIIPISKWWSHSISNVQWLCATCNLKKGSKLN